MPQSSVFTLWFITKYTKHLSSTFMTFQVDTTRDRSTKYYFGLFVNISLVKSVRSTFYKEIREH